MGFTQKETVLHIDDLSVQYGDKTIISNINLTEYNTVRDDTDCQGQMIAFLGRSGRGKSTLFKAMAGLVPPSKGNILIPDYSKKNNDGTQAAKQVVEGDVGFVDQKYTLFRHKTIYQSLQFAIRKNKVSEQEKETLIEAYLNKWGLIKQKNQYPCELSGGQRQRVAILEQIINSSYYIILDEPFSGLDVGNIENVKEAFRIIDSSNELNTIIFSTHDIELAVELADSIYVLGYPMNDKNETVPVGTIIKHFDLKQMGIAWKNTMTQEHYDLVKEIKKIMLSS